ncbi:hypothetical protein ACWKWU_00200 [Chitinophaga lutea]
MLNLLCALCALCCLTACFSGNGEAADPTTMRIPFRAEAGQPVGEAVRSVIGPEGGQLSHPAGLTMLVPPGTVARPTAFSIQPLSNTNPGGKGAAYRLLPHGSFTRPVTLRFVYDKTIPDHAPAGIIAMAYQNDHGIWLAQPGCKTDAATRTVTLETQHFSDWSVFLTVELIPDAGHRLP